MTHVSTIGQTLRIALMASSAGLGALVFSAPALAQNGESAKEGEGPAIVITGSRIARRDFTATSPVVTVDAELIEKSASVSLEANLNKLPQFSPALTQFVTGDIQANANNTVGASTISLRQLGANRNLVLIDGRRPTPINGTGVVDINSIPSAAIERVEVITGGASSTYGADAVGGVVNFILKKNFTGVAFDSQVALTQQGDGREYRISALTGAALADGRGSVLLGIEHYDRQAINQFDRASQRALLSSPNTGGTNFFLTQNYVSFVNGNNPSRTAIDSVFVPKGAPAAIVPISPTLYINQDATNSLFVNTSSGFGATYQPVVYGYNDVPIDGLIRKKPKATGVIVENNNLQLLSSPQNRWSFFAKGNYDISDDITFFSQVSMVKTTVNSVSQYAPAINGWGTLIPHGSDIYTGNASLEIASSLMPDGVTTNPLYRAGGKYGLNCPATGGCTNSMVFPTPSELTTLLNSRSITKGATETDAAYATRLAGLGCTSVAGAPGTAGSGANCPFQSNNFLTQLGTRYTINNNISWQVLAGFDGKVPGTDWTWEVFGSHGETVAKSDQYGFASVQRYRAVLSAPNYGKGFSYTGNSGTPGNHFEAATGTCASGVNPFQQPVWTPDCKVAVTTQLQNENRVGQDMWEADLQGGLFNLPYGQLRFAVGADYRKNYLSFHADSSATEGASFFEPVNGIFPQGNTSGTTEVKEVYGELLIPLLANLPFAKALNLEVGYRSSDYSTVGTISTYKINGEYAPFNWLRFRGGYQKASRAPNLGELYTSATQTLGVALDGDPCSRANPANPVGIGNYSANPIGFTSEYVANPADTAGNPDALKVEGICRTLMGNDAAAQYYIANRTYSTATFAFAFTSLVGQPKLKPEDAYTYTIGGVIRSPIESPWLRRFSLAVDYYNVILANGISQESQDATYRQCFSKIYNPTFDANNAFCQRISRNPTSGEAATVKIAYANGGRVEVSGIDFSLDWGITFKDVGIQIPGVFSINSQVSYLEHFKTTTDAAIIPLVDYAGSLGGGAVGTNAGAYRYKAFTTFSYMAGPATVSLQWQYKPKTQSVANASNPDRTTTNTTGAPAYSLFNMSGTLAVTRNATIRFGIDNLFNVDPPLTGVNLVANSTTVPGGSYDAGNYDVVGRRFFIGANFKL